MSSEQSNYLPTISVVTVVYNGVNCVEKTMISVLEQTYSNVEYIIIDGASTDGTVELIQQYESKLCKFVSEKDKGLYDAMNKGISFSSGDYVLFLNADDVFFDTSVLQDVADFAILNHFPDVIYGNDQQQMEHGAYVRIPGDISLLPKKHVISHQALLIKRDVLLKNIFNINYKYAADFEQISSIYLQEHVFKYMNKTIASTPMDSGTTYDNYRKSMKEHFAILKERGLYSRFDECSLLFRKNIVRFIKHILPNNISQAFFSFIARHYKVL